MKLGKLEFIRAANKPDLLAKCVFDAVATDLADAEVLVAEIDPDLADTNAFCEHYEVGLGLSANCVVVKAKRADRIWYAACVVLATDLADVNGAVRRHLGARKISFAPMEEATGLSSMEYGGINPIGLPPEWPILISERVMSQNQVIIGSGLRSSKLLVEPTLLASLPGVQVVKLAK